MKCLLVSVNYSDLLSLTLPYNREHFSDVYIVTSLDDYNNVLPIAEANNSNVFATDAFFDNGCPFNKWKALNQGIQHFGLYDCHDWLALVDCDICWPRDLKFSSGGTFDILNLRYQGRIYEWSYHHLLSPLRRMYPTIPDEVPEESTWSKHPHHRYQEEFSGYTMIFHTDSPSLKRRPWFPENWKHCGGGDSELAKRWNRNHSIRPPFDVLHLGESFVNWMGRTSKLADGRLPPNYNMNITNLQKLAESRRLRRGYDNETEKLK